MTITPTTVRVENMNEVSTQARLANIETLLLAILNQLRNGVKTQTLGLNVTVPIVSVPGLITVQP